MASSSRTRLYASLVRRGFHSLVLLGAADEDALELTHSFPLAQRHVHSLSLRCCAVTDRGLEALLDHLQVKILNNPIIFRKVQHSIKIIDSEINKVLSMLYNLNFYLWNPSIVR